jgi:hypothetical protein
VTADRDLLLRGESSSELSGSDLERIRGTLAERCGYVYTLDETRTLYRTLQQWGENRNFYSDTLLVAAGGDPRGVLDFDTVHYYAWGSTQISPFHHDASFWVSTSRW